MFVFGAGASGLALSLSLSWGAQTDAFVGFGRLVFYSLAVTLVPGTPGLFFLLSETYAHIQTCIEVGSRIYAHLYRETYV